MPKKNKHKKDEAKIQHCKVFDCVNAVVACIHDGWMTEDEWERIYLGVREKISYVTKHKVK